jgi:hypothetical protein
LQLAQPRLVDVKILIVEVVQPLLVVRGLVRLALLQQLCFSFGFGFLCFFVFDVCVRAFVSEDTGVVM